jgi:glycerol-3-phosphate dehydrogenase subunit C
LLQDHAGEKKGVVALYPGCLGRFADEEGETAAAVDVIRSLGYEVILPDLPCCGESRLLAADMEGARDHARRLNDRLQELAASGVAIVATCATCVLAIRREYPELLGLAPGSLSFVQEIHEFLARPEHLPLLPGRSGLPEPRSALYHRGCHQAALSERDQVLALLDRIKGLSFVALDRVCCGLAGVHGLRVENAPLSRALSRQLAAAVQETQTEEVISACPVCRLQIRSLGFKPLSPLALLRAVLFPPPSGPGPVSTSRENVIVGP